MPVDVSAEVIENRPLSNDYNVLALAAPAIAAAAAPGQFVMVRAGGNFDPLLRRPFSVFEILRNASGQPAGVSILSKRIGPSTRLIYELRPGQRVDCLGPLGRPFTAVDPPTEAWMVAGGVGLAPFATLAQALHARGVTSALFYGARRDAELFYLDFFRALDVELVLTTEDGSLGERGRVVAAHERRHAVGHRAHGDEVRPPLPGVGRADHGLRPRRLLQLRRADAQRARRIPPCSLVPLGARPGGRRDCVGIGTLRRSVRLQPDPSRSA
jgi:NAD(P)H-flavin reductase